MTTPLCVLTQRIPTSAIQSYHQPQRRTATILVQTRQNTKGLQTQLTVRILPKGRILTVGVPDKQKYWCSFIQAGTVFFLCRCQQRLKQPGGLLFTDILRMAVGSFQKGGICVSQQVCCHLLACHVPADRWQRNAAWCAGGIPQENPFRSYSCRR